MAGRGIQFAPAARVRGFFHNAPASQAEAIRLANDAIARENQAYRLGDPDAIREAGRAANIAQATEEAGEGIGPNTLVPTKVANAQVVAPPLIPRGNNRLRPAESAQRRQLRQIAEDEANYGINSYGRRLTGRNSTGLNALLRGSAQQAEAQQIARNAAARNAAAAAGRAGGAGGAAANTNSNSSSNSNSSNNRGRGWLGGRRKTRKNKKARKTRRKHRRS